MTLKPGESVTDKTIAQVGTHTTHLTIQRDADQSTEPIDFECSPVALGRIKLSALSIKGTVGCMDDDLFSCCHIRNLHIGGSKKPILNQSPVKGLETLERLLFNGYGAVQPGQGLVAIMQTLRKKGAFSYFM